MKNNIQTTTENATDKIQSAVENGKNFFNENADEYTAKIKKSYDYAKDKAQVATKEANDWVQKHPMMALGAALGTGLLVGRLFAPSKSSYRREKL
jgi:ElaB/YqjD/DUF883 family membrane-anchored ribosome-binding protein